MRGSGGLQGTVQEGSVAMMSSPATAGSPAVIHMPIVIAASRVAHIPAMLQWLPAHGDDRMPSEGLHSFSVKESGGSKLRGGTEVHPGEAPFFGLGPQFPSPPTTRGYPASTIRCHQQLNIRHSFNQPLQCRRRAQAAPAQYAATARGNITNKVAE
ncbi:hypothetical protein E2C01_061372 [Portunus trituberculatus]|uniref:Uncharacterized protein n=1 Tax=Portunus trituberculatus TaxID=210409 RepID=A0A5B7HAR4_PORTR|nr:hypothetical protein [Portunus trituberculatus]